MKTTSRTTTTAAKQTAEQSSRQAAGVWRCSTHASEREGGWTSTWPPLRLSDCNFVHVSVTFVTHLSNISTACRSNIFTLFVCLNCPPFNYFIIYLPAYLPPRIPPFHPGLPVCPPASLHPSSRERGGGGVGVGGVGKRQPGNSPQRLSLKPPLLHLTLCPGSPDKPMNTHTYARVSSHINTQPRRAWSRNICRQNAQQPKRRATPWFPQKHSSFYAWSWMQMRNCGSPVTLPESGAGLASLEWALACCAAAPCVCVCVKGAWSGTSMREDRWVIN